MKPGAPEFNASDWRGDTSWAILTATLYNTQAAAQCVQTDRALTGWQVGDEVVISELLFFMCLLRVARRALKWHRLIRDPWQYHTATTDFEPYHNDRTVLVACPPSLPCSSGLCVSNLQVCWTLVRAHTAEKEAFIALPFLNHQYKHQGGYLQASNGVEVGQAA